MIKIFNRLSDSALNFEYEINKWMIENQPCIKFVTSSARANGDGDTSTVCIIYDNKQNM